MRHGGAGYLFVSRMRREMQLTERSHPEENSAIRTYSCAFNIKINPRKNKRDVPAFRIVFNGGLLTGFITFAIFSGIIYCNKFYK